MKKRRILFLNHAAVLGGGEFCLLDLAQAYRDNSQVVLLSEGEFRAKLEAAGVTVQVLPAPDQLLSVRTSSTLKGFQALRGLWRLAQAVAEIAKDFEVIYANSQKAFVVATLARSRGTPPVVWYLQDILSADHFSWLNRRVAVTLANRYVAQVVVNSHATGEAFTALGGNPALVKVVYNGICPHRFATRENPPITLRQQLGVEACPVVGVFSRLSPWKGQHLLLEAVRGLPDVHVLMVGEALFGETDYVNQLKNLSSLPELQGRVHWLGFREDIPALMQACDLIVHPSTAPEPFGRVIVEAQLARKPVIAAAAGGAMELIEEGVNGCLFPAGNAVALRQVMQRLLGDQGLATRLGQQGEKEARRKFSLQQYIAHFDAVFNTV